jgi:hypothetical protein
MTYIYALIDPSTNQCRYVGKADNPVRRLQRHLQKKRLQDATYKAAWLRQVVEKGLAPEMLVLEEVPKDTWKESECFWIGYFRMIGAQLTNGTSGGDGGCFKGSANPMFGRKGPAHPAYGKPRPKDVVDKIRAKQVGRKRKLDPEALERIKEANRRRTGEKNAFYGRTHSEETKKRWSEKRKGAKLTDYQLKRLADGRSKMIEKRRLTCTVDGVTKSVVEWSKLSGVAADTIKRRLFRLGWSPKNAVFTDPQKYKQRASTPPPRKNGFIQP